MYAKAVRDHFNMLDSTALSFKTGDAIIVRETPFVAYDPFVVVVLFVAIGSFILSLELCLNSARCPSAPFCHNRLFH